jgi:uncharacterized protein
LISFFLSGTSPIDSIPGLSCAAHQVRASRSSRGITARRGRSHDPDVTVGVILAVLVGTVGAAFVSGLSGFAFGMIGLSVWAWVLEPRLLSPMVVFGSLVAQLVSLGAIRRGHRWRPLLPFLIGGLAGVPFGVRPGMLLARDLPPLRHGGRAADTIAGLIGGVMGGLAGLTGPVPTLWCTLRGWDKDVQRSVFQSFNLTMHAITLASYCWTGLLTTEVGWVFALMLPAILLPTWLGARLYQRISEAAFRHLVLGLLLVSGCVLVGSSLIG